MLSFQTKKIEEKYLYAGFNHPPLMYPHYSLISTREVTLNTEGYCKYTSLYWINRNEKVGGF